MTASKFRGFATSSSQKRTKQPRQHTSHDSPPLWKQQHVFVCMVYSMEQRTHGPTCKIDSHRHNQRSPKVNASMGHSVDSESNSTSNGATNIIITINDH
eukprot:230245-Amphidinium_carterae.1